MRGARLHCFDEICSSLAEQIGNSSKIPLIDFSGQRVYRGVHGRLPKIKNVIGVGELGTVRSLVRKTQRKDSLLSVACFFSAYHVVTRTFRGFESAGDALSQN